MGIEIDGRQTSDSQNVALDRVSADYFAALGIPIRAGRDIEERDAATSQPVCVINEAFARRFFAGVDPIGRRIGAIEPDGSPTAYHVVGIAADAHTHGSGRTFLIRTRSADPSIASDIRGSIDGVDPAILLVDLTDTNQEIAGPTTEDRTIAVLAFVFAGIAVLLAAIGLYGVLSFAVARRRREIAVRMALGAWSRQIVTLILGENVVLALAGLSAGVVLTYFASRLIASRRYGVTNYDPVTLSAAVALLVLVAGVAAFVPARRAARLDPLTALRNG